MLSEDACTITEKEDGMKRLLYVLITGCLLIYGAIYLQSKEEKLPTLSDVKTVATEVANANIPRIGEIIQTIKEWMEEKTR